VTVDRLSPLSEVLQGAEIFTDGDWVESRDQDPYGDVRLVQLADIGDGEYQDRSFRFLTSQKASELRCTYLEPDDILLARMPDPLGRACVFPGDAKRAVTVVDVCIIRVDSDAINVRWLMHSLNSPGCRRQIAAFATGTTRSRISRSNLGKVMVRVPPIEEQHRIAAVLDKADELRAKRRNALANLGTLTESIFIEMFGDPLSKASDTHLTTLGSAVDFHGGGTPSRTVAAYYRGAICWATSKDMKQRFLDDTQEHITQAAIDASATKLVAPGTVLVVVKSKVLAHSLPVALARVPTCFGQDLKGLSPRPGWDSTFVAESVRSARRWLLSRARGVNTEGLTLEHLRSMPIVNASPETQTAFARRVSLVVGLEDKTLSHVAHLDDLFYSLQQRAFQGAL
jgi:type I restriction enzyme S subunit